MDQENSKGQDKRNWRERLGIGAQGSAVGSLNAGAPASKDLPKISDNYRKEAPAVAARPVASARPAAAAAPAVKPAPMAPRANPKAQAPVAPDKLAERLRSQREASTKLAEQRVQVAKQRAETPAPPPAAKQVTPPVAKAATPPAQPNGAAKPKFTFAEEAENKAAAGASQPARPSLVPPVIPASPPPVSPQLSPARPPLGGAVPPVTPGFQQQRPYAPQTPPGFPQQGQLPPGFPQGYGQQPVPPYRPIDPASGYAPPPGYVPQQRGFGVPPQQGGFAPQNGPRLNVPPRQTPGLNANYQPQTDYNGAPQPQPGGFAPPPRMNRPPLRSPVPPTTPEEGYNDEFFDDAPQPPRAAQRPTSTDYQQAYREAEYGYEDETPRSKAPWILAGLLLLALLVAGLGVLGYQKFWKPMISGDTTTQEVPAVAPPDTPAKVQPEQPAAAQQPAAGGAAVPTKKQIYDRIVGDKEVLGGEVSAPSETPAAIPEPVPSNQAAPPPAAGEDAVPLPIPPPPGSSGGQQGSLDVPSEKQSAEVIIPAAGESQAAVAAPTPAPSTVEDLPTPDAPAAIAEPPAPGEVDAAEAATRSLIAEPTTADPAVDDAGTLADTTDPVVVAPKKKAEKKKVEAAKSKEKAAAGKLGSKPVVLVPPTKKAKAEPREPSVEKQVAANNVDSGDGLFGDDSVAAPQQQVPVAPAPVKKKRTLADLFSRNSDGDQAETNVASVDQAQPATNAVPKKQTVADESVSLAGDFVVQLASFRTRQEANAEFSRLQAKNGSTLGQFSPIVSEANVGGSTRFRLSVGRMSTQAQANTVCSKLFANGVRDCLVKRR